MNKVIRMALVCAFAGAALLYSGCTKDFSSDIKEIDTDLTALQGQVNNLNTALENFKTTANNAIEANKALIAQKADASTVSALQTELNNLKSLEASDKAALQSAINDLKPRVDALENNLTDLLADFADAQDDIAALKAAKTEFDGSVEDLLAQIGAIANRITSIVAVPALTDVIQTYALGTNDTTIFSAAFAIRPKEAAETLNKDNVEVILKEAKDRAAIDKIVKPNKVEVDAATGTVSVYAILGDLAALGAGNALHYSLDFFGKDEADSVYHVMSNFEEATINATPNNVLTLYKLVKDNKEVTAAPTIAKDVPYDAADSEFKPFDGYSIKVKIGDNFLAPADAAALLGFPAAKMAVKDTAKVVTAGITAGATKIDTAAFNTTVKIANVDKAKTSLNGTHTFTMVYAIGSATPATPVTPALTATYKIIPSVKSLGTLAKQTIKWNFIDGNRTVQATNYTTAPTKLDPAYTGTVNATRITKGSTSTTLATPAAVNGIVATSEAEVVLTGFPMHTDGGTYKVHNMVFPGAGHPADTLTLDFDVEVTKFPGDTNVALPDSAYKITAIPSPAKTFNIDFVKGAIPPADTMKFYGDLTVPAATPIYTAFDGAAAYTVDSVVVYKADGKREGTAAGVTATKSTLVFPANLFEYNKTYKVYVSHNAFGGIKYLYTQNIVVAPADFHLGTSAYVLDGNIVPIEGDTTTTYPAYSIKKAYLSKYLRIVDSENNLDNTAGLTVDATILYEDSAQFAQPKGIWYAAPDTTVGTAAFQPSGTHTVTDGILSDADSLNWNTYGGRELKVKAVLKAGTQRVDSLVLTLKTERPINAETTGAIANNRVAGVNDTILVSKKMKITSILNSSQNLINPNTGAIAAAPTYGIVVKIDTTKAVRGAVSTEAERDLVRGTEYEFIKVGGATDYNAIVIIGDSANPTVKAKVPVQVGYSFDYNHVDAIKFDVEVVATGSY